VKGTNATIPPKRSGPDQVGDWWRADWEEPDLPAHQETNQELKEGWRHPIAAMHVRRTDHGSEAPFRSVGEYVERIESWWNDYCARPENRNRKPARHPTMW
jgi:hypothetical protein